MLRSLPEQEAPQSTTYLLTTLEQEAPQSTTYLLEGVRSFVRFFRGQTRDHADFLLECKDEELRA